MQISNPRKIVIVGAGQAAAQAIISLRNWDYRGDIALLGEEPFPPYQRPPLSKAYMQGALAQERLYFKQPAWYQDHGVELVLATRATAIDPGAHRVEIDNGGHLDYDALIIATGSRARRLNTPGSDLQGVHELRSLADLERIRPRLLDGKNLVIVGAGYIGLEVAATARQMGLGVTVLEYAPRVLARVTSPLLSEFYRREHGKRGVDIRTGARLQELHGNNGAVSGARLADGTLLPADLVLVAVGIVPNQELASTAGIDCDDGIVVDRDARTSDSSVFAAGDCARRPLIHYGRTARLESVHNAVEQGRLAAAAVLGLPRPPEDCPWFWSDQFDLKLQIAGLSAGHDRIVVRGDPATRKFAACYLLDGRLIATDAVNSAMDFVVSKKLIAAGARVDVARLADASVSMKEIAATAIA